MPVGKKIEREEGVRKKEGGKEGRRERGGGENKTHFTNATNNFQHNVRLYP